MMIATTRRFEFVAESYEGDLPAISCDGLVPGTFLDLTHWQGNNTPTRFKADTSTEIALNFVVSPAASNQWAGAVVVNNHFDTDGILAIWTLLEPEKALSRRDLLIAAAEAGDFDEWPADDRGLWLDASIRALGAEGADDAEAYRLVLPQLSGLIDSLDDRRDLWGREWDQLQASFAAQESGALRFECYGTIGILIHSPGQPEAPGPLLARRFLPGATRYLLSFERDGGVFEYRYERPHYAWADTVVRLPLPQPDAAGLAQLLGAEWTAEGLPGMTGVVRTRRPIAERPIDLALRLAELDPH
jgi:hypothetical protein